MMTKTFTFESISCTLKRPKMKDAERREKIKSIVGSRPFAFTFADFQTATVDIHGADIALIGEQLDIGTVENAYYQFLELDEPFIARWQAEKSKLFDEVIVFEEGEKKR